MKFTLEDTKFIPCNIDKPGEEPFFAWTPGIRDEDDKNVGQISCFINASDSHLDNFTKAQHIARLWVSSPQLVELLRNAAEEISGGDAAKVGIVLEIEDLLHYIEKG